MKVFIIAMPGCGNLGDDLISTLLQKHLNHFYANDLEIGILCGEKDSLTHSSNVRLFYNPRNIPGKYSKRRKLIINFIRECDLIFIGGGGLFQDSHSHFTLHRYLTWVFYANCPVVCVGLGVGPIKYNFNQWYLRKVLKRKGVTIQVRDNESYKYLQSMGFEGLLLSSDIVEGSKQDIQKSESHGVILGASIRKWNDISYEKLIGIIKEVINKNKITQILFFAFEHSKENQEEFNFLKKIGNEMPCSTRVLAYGKDEDFIDSFTSVDFAIASRYHANILWQKLGIPVMPIPYAPKVYSLYKKSNIELHPINSDDFITEFYKISIKDSYSLPEVDMSMRVGFSALEKMNNRIFEFICISCSIIKSILIRTRLWK